MSGLLFPSPHDSALNKRKMVNVWMNIILLFSRIFYIVALVLVRIGFLEDLKMVHLGIIHFFSVIIPRCW